MVKCAYCGREVALPFKCKYCGRYFCEEHRLPEFHGCSGKPLIKRREKVIFTYIPKRPETIEEEVIIQTVPPSMFQLTKSEVGDFLIGVLIVFGVGISMILPPFGLDLFSAIILGLALAIVYGIHEMSHKMMARHLHVSSRYVLDKYGTIITLLLYLFPVKYAYPGTVFIGTADRNALGKIAMAGPLSNAVLSSLMFYIFYPLYGIIPFYVAFISTIIGFFNMIPVGVLDGLKIFTWNKKVWAILFLWCLILLISINLVLTLSLIHI